MNLEPVHREILSALRKRNMSRRDLEEHTGRRQSTICGRAVDLIMGGLIEPCGVKRCPHTGRRVEILRIRKREARAA